MHPRNVLILMLVMATVALDLVVGNWVRMPIVLDEASPHFLVYVALVFAELTFIAGWVVFGGGKSIARFLIATFALWLLAWPMSGGEGIFVTRPVFVLGTFLVMVATLLTGLRLARFGITCAEDSSRKPTQVASGAAAQFSLGSFMAWITVFCVALGAALDVEVTGLHLIRIVVYLAPFQRSGSHVGPSSR